MAAASQTQNGRPETRSKGRPRRTRRSSVPTTRLLPPHLALIGPAAPAVNDHAHDEKGRPHEGVYEPQRRRRQEPPRCPEYEEDNDQGHPSRALAHRPSALRPIRAVPDERRHRNLWTPRRLLG